MNNFRSRPTYFARFIDSVGDGSGTKQMATTADNYYATAPTTQRMYVYSMVTHIVDTGVFGVATYGAGAALGTGIEIDILDENGTTVTDITNGIKITTNGDWQRYAFDHYYDSFGAGDNALVVRWNFEYSGGPLELYPSWSLAFIIPDSLAGLVSHTVNVRGHYG